MVSLPVGVLTDIEKFFMISDGKSGLLQTGERMMMMLIVIIIRVVKVCAMSTKTNYIPVFSVFICSYMFLAPVFGYLGDRYNRKLIMCGGISFWSLVTLASSYVTKDVSSIIKPVP